MNISQERPEDEITHAPAKLAQGFQVVWDGRKSGPGGALLFAPEHPTVAASEISRPMPQAYQSMNARVRATRAQAGDRWFTMQDVANWSRLSLSQTAGAVQSLVKQGEIAPEATIRGRDERRRYRWLGDGR